MRLVFQRVRRSPERVLRELVMLNFIRLCRLVIVAGAVPALLGPSGAHAAASARAVAALQAAAPFKGYLAAHAGYGQPQPLLGGPIDVSVRQDSAGVFVALPDRRRLDPRVFGSPAMPRAVAGTPGINGVPLMARGVDDGRFTVMKSLSPFGDKFVTMPNGHLELSAHDATATDAAATEDRVSFRASWQDKARNTYEVRCCERMAAHGVEFPTFGGVVTNHILHGSSRIGTALMPTEFTYVAFWGMGEVRKNGKVLDAPRLVHGMLTEYVRTAGYKLASDDRVTPGRRQFHLMVPPFAPDPQHGVFVPKPVATGFGLPNGKTLPFWHVMFESLDIDASRAH